MSIYIHSFHRADAAHPHLPHRVRAPPHLVFGKSSVLVGAASGNKWHLGDLHSREKHVYSTFVGKLMPRPLCVQVPTAFAVLVTTLHVLKSSLRPLCACIG